MKTKKGKRRDLFWEMVDLAMEHPELVPDRLVYITGARKDIGSLLSPAKMELIRSVRKRPMNISELAAAAGRSIQSVSRDLATLGRFGIVGLDRSGREKTVKLEKDAIIISFTA
jgi:predicted transcriptional regulator